jgi:predicted amidohydrolase YtcJ
MRTILFFLLTTFAGFLTTGCQMKQKIDMLLTNGTIYAVDSLNGIYEAMAIDQGKVIAMGTKADLTERYQADSVVDATGKFVYPGFIDAHCHFYGLALNQQYVDLTGSVSFDEVIDRLERHADDVPGKWIVGRGWDQNLWPVKAFPDKARLDALFPDRPVLLIRVDGHSVLANREALKQAGIGLKHGFKPGEVEVRNGELTGILSEGAADHMRNSVPEVDDAAKTELLKKAEALCFAAGLTAVSDAGLESPLIRLIDSLQNSGVLRMYIYAMLSPTSSNVEAFVTKGPYQTDRLSVRSIKLYADGSLGSRTALLKQPYSDDPGRTGIPGASPETINELCRLAYKHGYQVNTHCIGDSAVSLILNLYASHLKGKNDLRWRIEHAQVVAPDDFALFGKYSVVPSVQATHATSDMYWAGERLGPERLKGAYAYHDLLEQNGWLPNGTDFPIEGINPLHTFYAAVERKDLKGFPEGGFMMENALSREEALRSVTIWAAKADFAETTIGSLEPGKSADFVVLDRDIMTIAGKEIPEVTVQQTVISGKTVYRK